MMTQRDVEHNMGKTLKIVLGCCSIDNFSNITNDDVIVLCIKGFKNLM